MKKRFFTVFGFLLIGALISAQPVVPSFIKDSLDSYVERALSEWQIPGIAVLVQMLAR